MDNNFKTIDEYISQYSDSIQIILKKIRQVIKESSPNSLEKISYQMPTFYLNENLVHFAAYKKHIGFYPTPSAIDAFKNELLPYKFAKGSIQFPIDKPIPYDLIKRIVEYRVDEVNNKNAK